MKSVFVVACLACTCHGQQAKARTRRVLDNQRANERLRTWPAGDSWPVGKVDSWKVRAARQGTGRFKASQAVAGLLLIITATHVFNPSCPRAWSFVSKGTLAGSHPAVLSRQSCRGHHVPLMGKSEVDMLQKKYELTRLYHGPEHPDTLKVQNDYAVKLRILGREAEAESVAKEVFELRRRVLGPENPETMMALDNYAQTISGLGREAEAEPLRKTVLNFTRTMQGNETLDTFFALRTYAATLVRLGREVEAAPFINETLKLASRSLGPELLILPWGVASKRQLATLKALREYAATFTELGLHSDAEGLYKEVLLASRQSLDASHPLLFNALNRYAVTLVRLGREAEAEPFLQELSDLTKKTNGPELIKEVVDFRVQILGPDHSVTIGAMQIYADTLSVLGRWAKIEPLRRIVLQGRHRILGAGHPDTLAAIDGYAKTLRSLAGTDGNETLQSRLRDLQEIIPVIFDAASRGGANRSQGLESYAENLFQQALQLGDEVVGSKDSDVGM